MNFDFSNEQAESGPDYDQFNADNTDYAQQSNPMEGYRQPHQGGQAIPPQHVVTINKHIYVWVFCFLVGGFGVDRFVRGSIGLGVCKLLFNWLTFGIWATVDWLIAVTKAYGGAFGNEENLVFVNGKYAK